MPLELNTSNVILTVAEQDHDGHVAIEIFDKPRNNMLYYWIDEAEAKQIIQHLQEQFSLNP